MSHQYITNIFNLYHFLSHGNKKWLKLSHAKQVMLASWFFRGAARLSDSARQRLPWSLRPWPRPHLVFGWCFGHRCNPRLVKNMAEINYPGEKQTTCCRLKKTSGTNDQFDGIGGYNMIETIIQVNTSKNYHLVMTKIAMENHHFLYR